MKSYLFKTMKYVGTHRRFFGDGHGQVGDGCLGRDELRLPAEKNSAFMSLNIEMIGCVKFSVCVMGLEFLKIARNHNRACALRHFARREAGRRVVN